MFVEVAEVEVEQVVVQGFAAAVAQLVADGVVVFFFELGRGPDDEVAAVVGVDGERLGLVGEIDDVAVVFFVVGGDGFGVDAYPFAGDEGLELVLDVV